MNEKNKKDEKKEAKKECDSAADHN